MKTLNLFLDMEFTSLSPDAQPISLGIVSDEYERVIKHGYPGSFEIKREDLPGNSEAESENIIKQFYSEFSDYDINCCDDWVKENVVKKLKLNSTTEFINNTGMFYYKDNITEGCGNTQYIKNGLKEWISQFSDYDLQFIIDCGTFDWYHFLQLIGEWEVNRITRENATAIDSLIKEKDGKYPIISKVGLPKLPPNISPVPFDLNDLIAIKKGITPREAFELDREVLAFGNNIKGNTHGNVLIEHGWVLCKHFSLSDAKVIKEIYNKLK